MKKTAASLLLTVTAIIWGFAFVAQVSGSSVGNFTYSGIRYLLGAAVLIPVILIVERKKITRPLFRQTLIGGAVTGTVMCAAVNLQQFGISLTGNAGKAGFITGLYMVFVPIVGIFMKRKPSLFVWLGVASALSGLYLLCMNGNTKLEAGDLLVLVCAFGWTAHIYLIDHFSRQTPPILFSAVQFMTCGIISIILSLVFEDFSLSAIFGAKTAILYGGLVSVGVGYTFQVIGQKELNPTFATIVMSAEAIFAAVGGAILLSERMSISQYIGCVLMFAGIILSQLNPHKKHGQKQSEA